MSPKTGRPTDNPKNADRITVRLDNESVNILNEYCKSNQVDKGEAVRRGIKKLEGEKK